MIIVSQNRDIVINFDNVTHIDIEGNGIIFANTCKLNPLIGEYETEERAKEVLQEIITAYTNFEHFKATTEEQKRVLKKTLIWQYETFDVYKMPKE